MMSSVPNSLASPAVQALVNALVRARQSGIPADDASPGLQLQDAAQAYAVQAGVAQALDMHAGQTPAHWKSGGPNRQAVLTHAPLPAAGVWMSPAVAGTWPFAMRGIEAEVALRLGRAVDAALAASLDVASASQLVDAMTVSIEVVDSRWQRRTDAPAWLKLADLQSHGALVLGAWMPYAARDWTTQVCRLRIGSQDEQIFTGTHTLADPAWLLRDWLQHATRDGAVVPAGAVVTTGSWNGMTPAAAGDLVRVRFDGLGEASLQL
jgi:2-keto-4-pentenoate hydratase